MKNIKIEGVIESSELSVVEIANILSDILAINGCKFIGEIYINKDAK